MVQCVAFCCTFYSTFLKRKTLKMLKNVVIKLDLSICSATLLTVNAKFHSFE